MRNQFAKILCFTLLAISIPAALGQDGNDDEAGETTVAVPPSSSEDPAPDAKAEDEDPEKNEVPPEPKADEETEEEEPKPVKKPKKDKKKEPKPEEKALKDESMEKDPDADAMVSEECEILQKCQLEKDENTAMVVGILERKLAKLEKGNKELKEMLKKLEDGEKGDDKKDKPKDETTPESEKEGETTPKPEGKMGPAPKNESGGNEDYYPLKTVGPNPRCLEGRNTPGPVNVKRCVPDSPKQGWKYENGSFVNKASELCLDGNLLYGSINAVPCNEGLPSQQWQLLQDNTITNTASAYCLTTGAYWALTSECDGEVWQQYDYWGRLQQQQQIPGYYIVTTYF